MFFSFIMHFVNGRIAVLSLATLPLLSQVGEFGG